MGVKAKNGGLRQVKKTSLSKEDLSIPGRDRERRMICLLETWKDKRYGTGRSREVYI